MLKTLLFILLQTIISIPSSQFIVDLSVKDEDTNKDLVGAKIEVLDENDSIIATKEAKSGVYRNRELIRELSRTSIYLSPEPKQNYQLRISYPNYETKSVVIPKDSIGNANETLVLGDIFLKKIAKPDLVMIIGEVKDASTKEYLIGAQIEFLDENDSIVATKKARGTHTENGVTKEIAIFGKQVPRIDGNYTIKVSYPMYETEYVLFPMGELDKSVKTKEIGDILLFRKEIVPSEE
ncbi:MAG: hypothetical protein NC453_23750 [Muribaculum sp.]|nr:hypothetical protein [Muribaculum sp.]